MQLYRHQYIAYLGNDDLRLKSWHELISREIEIVVLYYNVQSRQVLGG